MSRMNNTSRSLQIISRQNGWDPTEIEGFGSIADVYHHRDHPNDNDTWAIPKIMTDPQAHCDPSYTAPKGKPEPGDTRSKMSDPYPGMPGAAE